MVESRVELSTAEERLESARRDQPLLSAAVQSSRAAIICEDLNRCITDWNDGAQITFGYSPEEVLGKSINILNPSGRRDDLQAVRQKITNGELVEPFETVRVAKDGRKVYALLSLSPIRTTRERSSGFRRFLMISRGEWQTGMSGLVLRQS